MVAKNIRRRSVGLCAWAFRPLAGCYSLAHRLRNRRTSSFRFLGPLSAVFLLTPFLWLALSPTRALTAGPTTQVCIALDGSGSIYSGDFTTMINGLAAAVQDSSVMPQNGSVELTVLQFGGIVYEAPIIVPPTVIDSAAAATSAANAILATTQLRGYTPTDLAIDTCTQQMTGSPNFAGAAKQFINISTDGDPNSMPDTLTARNNAVAAGIDEIDLEAIGPAPTISNMLQIAYPSPGYLAPPFSGGGFVIQVSIYSDYANAIRQKLQVIVPQPTATVAPTATPTPIGWSAPPKNSFSRS